MESFADVGNTLQVLAAVSLVLGVAMAVYWGTRRGYPGFGLWTVCNLLFAASCVLLADREHWAAYTVKIIIPVFMILGTVLRLEGLRRFFGRPRLDFRSFALPVVAAALLVVFQYVHDSDLGRTETVTVSFLFPLAGMSATFYHNARRTGTWAHWSNGTLAAVSCALLVGFSIYWATGAPLPLVELTRANFSFFVLVVMFEVVWFIVFVSLGTNRATELLEVEKAAVESSLAQLATIVAFLPDATQAIDSERRIIAWNKAAEELTGLPAAEAIGKTSSEVSRALLGRQGASLLDAFFDD